MRVSTIIGTFCMFVSYVIIGIGMLCFEGSVRLAAVIMKIEDAIIRRWQLVKAWRKSKEDAALA